MIDFIHTVGAIYLLVQYFTSFDISRTLSRPEEKYYRMFLATEDKGVQPKVIFVYLVITLVYRLLYYMIYFETFGALVQIIIKMIAFCFNFLALSTLFLLAFSLLGHILFNDIEEFWSFPRSFNQMYQSVFGGFDFTIYANSTLTTEYYGRIFMSLFLLGFACCSKITPPIHGSGDIIKKNWKSIFEKLYPYTSSKNNDLLIMCNSKY